MDFSFLIGTQRAAMPLTHQTHSAPLLAFGLVSCIADGEFIRFEKEKNKPGVYHEKQPQTTRVN